MLKVTHNSVADLEICHGGRAHMTCETLGHARWSSLFLTSFNWPPRYTTELGRTWYMQQFPHVGNFLVVGMF